LVIPSINCPDFEGARDHIKEAEKFSEWIHIDIEDGKFVSHTTWGNPEELQSLEIDLNIEVHLMVEHPEETIESWLRVGAKRVIVHLQTIKDKNFILDICKRYEAEAVLSFDPTVSIDDAAEGDFDDFKHFQILSVFPGPSGQVFEEKSLEKIKSLREKVPTATIEVDGGVNVENIRRIREAGADFLVSGNYIFSSPNPKEAYKTLRNL